LGSIIHSRRNALATGIIFCICGVGAVVEPREELSSDLSKIQTESRIVNWDIIDDVPGSDSEIWIRRDKSSKSLRLKRDKSSKSSKAATSSSASFNAPSPQPSTASSSSQPTACKDSNSVVFGDEPWTLRSSGNIFTSPLEGKTCKELEGMSSDHEKWCKAISSQTASEEKCALEACCFCGGGELVPLSCRNLGNWRLGPAEANWGCEDIEKDPNRKELCDVFKDTLFDGLTAAEACCTCGGGETHSAHATSADGRRLQDSSIKKVIRTTSLGESPGIPNLEYLGLGYDFIRGNPRGSSKGELDPGE
jgi:hypothetical protein